MNDDTPKDSEPHAEPPAQKYKTITQEEFDEKLALHHQWLELDEEEREPQPHQWLELDEEEWEPQKANQLVLQNYDLTHLELAGKKLREVNFEYSNLKGILLINTDLHEAMLVGADLSGAKLSKADLIGAKLSKADLSGAKLCKADFDGADLSGANLREVDLRSAALAYANLRGANLMQADLGGANLIEVDLNGANLMQADLGGAELQNINLWGTHLEETTFGRANLEKAILSNAHLEGSNFYFANLTGAKFQGAVFRPEKEENQNGKGSADSKPKDSQEIPPASFHSANLTEADFTGVDFKDTDLSNADLRNAILVKTDFTNANTDGTHFGGANVSNADMPSENYFENRIANVNESTRMVRTLFLTLLGALAFCGLTILSTQDSQLLNFATSFNLPIIGTSVSIKWFYFLAPWFLLGLFVYFHLYLIKHCWLLAKQPRILCDNSGLGDKILPWVLNSWAIHYFENPEGEREGIQWSREFFSLWLAWLATPVCLVFFWGRSFVSQDVWLTETHFWAAVICLVLAIGFRGIAQKTLAERGWTFKQRSWWVNAISHFVFVGLVILAVWGQTSQNLTPDFISEKLRIPNIAYQEVSIKPENWDPDKPALGVKGADLSSKDLSGAKASNAFLVNANLYRSIWHSAELKDANISGADLTYADLRGAKGLVVEQFKEAKNRNRAFYDNELRKKLGISDDKMRTVIDEYQKNVLKDLPEEEQQKKVERLLEYYYLEPKAKE